MLMADDVIEVTVQKMKTRPRGSDFYYSYWIVLPKQLCQALNIGKGTALTVSLENGGLLLKKKDSV